MDLYVKLAKDTIYEFVKTGKTINAPTDLPDEMTKNRAGIFVSIHLKKHKDNEEPLRGCIGTFMPTKKSITHEIIDNAISACSRDYRFTPVRVDELDDLEVSVDVLGKPEPLPISDRSTSRRFAEADRAGMQDAISQLDPKKYGVIVKSQKDSRSGLLLPDIPGIDDPAYQVAIAYQKAGIDSNEPVYLYRFEVVRHK